MLLEDVTFSTLGTVFLLQVVNNLEKKNTPINTKQPDVLVQTVSNYQTFLRPAWGKSLLMKIPRDTGNNEAPFRT
jgi:molecular chaperone DnaK (HSP70)